MFVSLRRHCVSFKSQVAHIFIPPPLPLFSFFIQWAGKTIALGTFPAAEADEKCARAKALTRAWRSTMRPKPTRDWVMVELERLGVRVVSGRLGRKAGEEEEEGKKPGGTYRKENQEVELSENSHACVLQRWLEAPLHTETIVWVGPPTQTWII